MSERVKVAQTDQLQSGARKLCTVEGRRIAVFNVDGTIHAIDNHCTHRDGPVGAGQLDDVVITCPWHGWQFNVTTGHCLEVGGANLRCYPIIVQGRDVFIDITSSDANETDDAIYCYLVRYGALGDVSRVGCIKQIPCRRCDRVVVHTDRGIELAEVLAAHQDNASGSRQERPVGELLRVMTDEDQSQEQNMDNLHQPTLERYQELIAEHCLSITPIDAEQLFDGQTIIIYYLGQPSEKLGPLAVELAKAVGNRRVQFQPVETE